MTPNEVARRYSSSKPGYELIDFESVALPVYLIEFDAVTLTEKQVPMVDEFLLRCVDQGLSRPCDLAGFLGLEEPFVVKRLAGLFGTDHVTYVRVEEEEDACVSLTKRGRDALSKLITVRPQRQILTVAIDGIIRAPITSRIHLLKPRDIKAFGLKEIRAFPNRPPEVGEIADLDLSIAFPRSKKGEPVQRILSVSKIGRRTRRFREAVMLIFKAETGVDVQVQFAVDGRPFPEMDEAFRNAEGVKELKILEQVLTSSDETRKVLRDLGAEDLLIKASMSTKQSRNVVRPAVAEIIRLDEEEAERRQKLESTKNQEEILRLREELERVHAQKAALEKSIASIDVRDLEVHEHRPLFEHALSTARERLLIVSPWINDRVMTLPRLKLLENRAGQGVKIFVGYGIEDADERRAPKEGLTAISYMERIAKVRPNFTFKRLGDTHAKILLVDRLFVVVGSFNWMSFEGDTRRKFREEKSIYVGIPEKVDEWFQKYVPRFE